MKCGSGDFYKIYNINNNYGYPFLIFFCRVDMERGEAVMGCGFRGIRE